MLTKSGYSGHEFVSRVVLSRLSSSALDREHRFDLVRLAAIDGRLAAFVVKRVDDHLEVPVPIQIKDCRDLIHVRSDRLRLA
jgi:hypothetical protein